MSIVVDLARRTVLVLLLIAVAFAPASAADRTFEEAAGAVRDPERGFWRFLAVDYARVTTGELRDAARDGLTLGYAVVRLDDFRGRDLPAPFLARLDRAFALTRGAGLKVILRFAYNYPDDEQSYRDAEDAPLARVRRHVRQLRPVLRRNADVIYVLQAGFIGAWGEGHSSSNGLTRPAAKRAIRDELLRALPAGRMLQWRYPADLIRWSARPPTSGPLARIGVHNDCFLSSPTDVGTYSGKRRTRAFQKTYVAAVSGNAPFTGETCGAEPRKIRSSCDAIREEGEQFRLVSLNRDYYRPFFRRWAREGCLGELTLRMGHRLVLVSATAPDVATAGGRATIRVAMRNAGWSRLHNPRPLRLVARHRASGRTHETAFRGDLRDVTPGSSAHVFAAPWDVPADAPEGTWDLFVTAPDAAAALAGDARYALRFANADGGGAGWSSATGRFALGMSVEVAPP